jgi:hypothetical protein
MTTTDEPVIEVKHLAKRYRIGLDRTYKTFSDKGTDESFDIYLYG